MRTGPAQEFSFDTAGNFIVALSRTAHGNGVSSVRLESFLSRVAETMGLKGEFMVTPTYVNVVLWRNDDPTQHSRFVKMPAPDFNMSKLADIGNLVADLEAGRLTLEESFSRLSDIDRQVPRFGLGLVGLGYALSGCGFAVLLGSSWSHVIFAGLLSLLVYGIVLLAGHSKWLAQLLEITAAVIAGAAASLIAILLPGGDPLLLTLCGLVVLIPGLGLTLGLAEISAQHTMSGIQRLIGAILSLMRLFIGTAIGMTAVAALWSLPPTVSPPAIAAIWVWLSVVGLVVGLSFIFQVAPRDFRMVILGGLVTFAGVQIGNQFGYWQGSFLGAAALAAYANLFAITLHRPASIILLTGIMILVPGAAAYRGLASAVKDGAAAGLSAEWQVLVIIFAIISGLVVANNLVPPKSIL